MKQDAFSGCHPAVNFLFFVGAIGFGVVIQHPAYLAAGVIGAAVYYLLLTGKQGLKLIFGTLILFALISLVNPLMNHYGKHVLFTCFGKPYTLEALCYGAALGAIFVIMMLWFGCYSIVLTSDKFTALFGNLIPALSLLLVMVLRMIPGFMRKARQISGARTCIGKGIGEAATKKEKLLGGMTVLSALTDWALEGSIVTADSMRCRGYGGARRTHFQVYRMSVRDWVLLGWIALLAAATVLVGEKSAEFIPVLRIPPLSAGFFAYIVYLLIPSLLHWKEALTWHILRSRI